MIRAEILNHGISVCFVDIPENENDITYAQSLEFIYKSDSIQEWLAEKIKNEEEYEIQYVGKLAETVASVLGVDPRSFDSIDGQDQVDTLLSLWGRINKIIADFEPQANGGEFCHNHKWYQVPEITKSIITKQYQLKDSKKAFTLQQVVEIGKVEKQLSDSLKALKEKDEDEVTYSGKTINKDEAVIQKTFTSALRQIVLCTAEPHEIPVDVEEFEQWMEERMLEFQNISMKNAVSTLFFLGGITNHANRWNLLSFIMKQSQSEDFLRKNLKTIQKGSSISKARRKKSTKGSARRVTTLG